MHNVAVRAAKASTHGGSWPERTKATPTVLSAVRTCFVFGRDITIFVINGGLKLFVCLCGNLMMIC